MIKYLVLIFVALSGLSYGQNYKIEVNLKSAANKEVNLAYYYISNIYIKDTIQLDNNGFGIFEGDSLLPQGLYKIYLNDANHFDFLLGADQDFKLTNETFSVNDLKVEGAVETEEFAKYMVYLEGLQKKNRELQTEYQSATGEEKKKIGEEMDQMTNSLHNYWKNINEKYPDTFLAKFLMANLIPTLDISTLPDEVLNNDSLLLAARFNYQKEHYWDNFDYTDERFLYTPLFKPKLEAWFTKALYQNYDSVKPYVFELIENTRPHKQIFQFVTAWFLNTTITSNVMGMDALFINLAKKYYLSGEAYWAGEDTMDKIKENVRFIENNLIGMTAPDLTLESVDGEYFNLHRIESKYTLLLIFEPNCSHCNVYVPDFHKRVYEKFKDKGLKVYAIYSMDKRDEWEDFLYKNNLYDWINVWDPQNMSNFKILYDARTTPGVYLLDENKKIVGKKMSVDQLLAFFEHELN